MKHSRRLIVFASFLILTIFIGGCGSMTKEDKKEEKIKKSFEKTLGMYPIKNLEDLYDKEGYRDEEFDKNDKGTWVIQNYMTVRKKIRTLKREVWYFF